MDIEYFLRDVIDYLSEKEKMKRKTKEIKYNLNIVPFGLPINLPFGYPYISPKFRIKKKRKKYKKSLKNAIKIPKIEEKEIKDVDKLNFFLSIYGSTETVETTYPVSKYIIDGQQYVFAYAKIEWDKENKELIYKVIEPELNEKEKQILKDTLDILSRRLDIPIDLIKSKEKVIEYIVDKSREIWKIEKIPVDPSREHILLYYIIRDTVGYGRIDPLMNDPLIEDISCNGVNIPIFIFHRNPLVGEIRTNVMFTNFEELDNFVIKLALRSGRSVSVASPLLDAALPEGHRIQITYGKDISMRGSSFTIRKFTKDPFTPIDLINFGTTNFEMLAYLWTLIEEGRSMLIAGGTATGKTSFLNAISLFIKPEKKIVSIEDTPELQLPHPNWLQEVARPGYGPQRYGEVTLFDLLKAALRQRPDYIIVGEVRGQEAYILFQAMATGHAGLGTIHAESFEGLIDRLISPPISLPPFLLEILDAVVFLRRIRYKGKYVRRVDKIYEIVRFNKKKNDVERVISYRWDPKTDTFIPEDSVVLSKVMELRNINEDELKVNLKFKIRILEYLYENKIRDYRKIAEILKLYYYDPERLAKIVNF